MKRKLVPILAGLLAIAVLLGGCSQSSGPSTAGGQKIVTMAATMAWDTLIPFNTTNGNTDAVLELIYDKLIVLNADGTIKPRLAKSWSIDDATYTKITFVLNENAKWHDGKPVTAEDVVFTAELMANPDISVARRSKVAPFTGTKNGLRDTGKEFGVKAIDKNTGCDMIHPPKYAAGTTLVTAEIRGPCSNKVMPKRLQKYISTGTSA